MSFPYPVWPCADTFDELSVLWTSSWCPLRTPDQGQLWEIRVMHRNCFHCSYIQHWKQTAFCLPMLCPESVKEARHALTKRNNWKCVCLCACVCSCAHTRMQIDVWHYVRTFLLRKSGWLLDAMKLEILKIYKVISAFRIFIPMNWINWSLALNFLICNLSHSYNYF